MLAIFVERRRADAVQFAARQRRLQEVGRVHRALGLACADERMHFVDEQDDLALGRDHFFEHRLEALLELAAIFGSRDQRAHVEREQLLVAQRFRHVAVDDAQRKAFDDRRLAHAGLADQHRIVLGAPRQHLDRAADLLVAADDRIELAFARRLGEVASVFLQRLIGVLRARRIRRAALAQVIDRGVERLGRHARIGQDPGCLGALLHRKREKQALDGDIGIAGLLGDFLGIIEQARRGGGEIELPRSRSLDFGKLRERQLHLFERVTRSSSRPVDETGGQPFLVLQKHLEKVLGGELLMALAERKRLCALHEAARPFRVLVQVHGSFPFGSAPRAPKRRRAAHTIKLPRFRGLGFI